MSADCTPQGASAASSAPMKITTRAMPEARIANCSKASRLSPVESIARRPKALVAGHAAAERAIDEHHQHEGERADRADPDDLVDHEAAQGQIAAEAGRER